MAAKITVLDYGAGNIASVLNCLAQLEYRNIVIAQSPADILEAQVSRFRPFVDANAKILIFPGVGCFATAMGALESLNFKSALKTYLEQDMPFLGICVGMQVLFAESEESPGCPGLGVFPAHVKRFSSADKCVPHIGWNKCSPSLSDNDYFYFVHSFAVLVPQPGFSNGSLMTRYGDETFVSGIRRGNLYATQFHPEKSGRAGLNLIRGFLEGSLNWPDVSEAPALDSYLLEYKATPRIIACMDVCDGGNGVPCITKGDQYNVHDSTSQKVRNYGSPSEKALDYYLQGADEIVFLNIMGYQQYLLEDNPILKVLKETSKNVFIPLTVGGGIRDYSVKTAEQEVFYDALHVADTYFRAGADKISIGSDAVLATEEWLKNGGSLTGRTALELISAKYGRQAVVVSIDPIRVYVSDPSETSHETFKTSKRGPSGEQFVWYQCTIHGGRTKRDLDVLQLVKACEAMGAGEFMVNSISNDGQGNGYDLELLALMKRVTSVPVIASSGAGNAKHFLEAVAVGADACLAAGIFHRNEVTVSQIKDFLTSSGVPCRTDKR